MNIASTLLVHNGMSYVNRRAPTCATYPNQLQNAGGKVEMGEDLHVAAQREVWEEAGLSLSLDRFTPIGSSPQRHEDGSEYTVHTFVVVLQKHELPLNKEPEKQGDWMLVSHDWLIAHQDELVPALADILQQAPSMCR